MSKEDIFDRLMSLPILRIFKPFYLKYKEVLLYLFFGGLTFLVSISSFALFNIICELNEHIANFLSWTLAVSFAYITNKIWVFKSNAYSKTLLIKELVNFVGGRIFTLVIEEVILFIFITWLQYNSMIVKLIAQVIVIVLNYVVSKLYVFKK